MNSALELAIVQKYPEIFREHRGDPQHTCMAWGLAVGDGWAVLIDELCAHLTSPLRRAQSQLAHLKPLLGQPRSQHVQNGPIVTAEEIAAAEQAVALATENTPTAAQVKEKFGGLRFYVNGATPEQYALINLIESLSERTCEQCGSTQKAMIYTIGWHQCLCSSCADKSYGIEVSTAHRAQRQS